MSRVAQLHAFIVATPLVVALGLWACDARGDMIARFTWAPVEVPGIVHYEVDLVVPETRLVIERRKTRDAKPEIAIPYGPRGKFALSVHARYESGARGRSSPLSEPVYGPEAIPVPEATEGGLRVGLLALSLLARWRRGRA